MMTSDTLTPEDWNALEEDGIAKPTSQGKRKISASFLTTPPRSTASSSSGSIQSTASASIRVYRNKPHSDIEVPDKAYSADGLIFIGIREAEATEIFDRWSTRPLPNPDDLIDYVRAHFSKPKLFDLSEREYMEQLGVRQWLQDAILHPDYKQIYLTRRLVDWLFDSLRVNFNALERIVEHLKEHVATRGRAGKKKQKRESITNIFPSSSNVASSSTDPAAGITRHAATLGMASESPHFPQAHVEVAVRSPLLPNHEIFYKAKCPDEMPDDVLIKDDGTIDMRTLSSFPGGDFNATHLAWYWTSEYATALQHKDYAEIRNPASEQWILSIQVSKEFLSTLNIDHLWFGFDWKQYVWCCKKMYLSSEMPSKFAKYAEVGPDQIDVLTGHICWGMTGKFARMKKEEVQNSITEDNCLTIGGRKATQWCVTNDKAAIRLSKEVHGKLHIDIFKPKTENSHGSEESAS